MANNVHPTAIKEALAQGAKQLRRDCNGFDDAITYVPTLCQDVVSDLDIDMEECVWNEEQFRQAAINAISAAYGR
jgi:hypothetical protein